MLKVFLAEMCRVGDFKGWVTLRLNFRLNGYVSGQCLWTVRWGNGCSTTLPLEVFTLRSFVADFIRLKLNFIQKQKIAFWATFWGLRSNARTPPVARWKARGRLPIRHNWTFRYLLRLRRYKQKSVEVGIFRKGWVTVSRNLRRQGRRPPTAVDVRKLEWCPFVWYQNIRSALVGFVTKHAYDRRRNRQTDGQTDRITTHKTALALLRRAVKTEAI